MSEDSWVSGTRRLLIAGLAAIIALSLLIIVVVVLPPAFAPRRLFDNAGEAVRVQNDIRTTLLQGLGGAAVLLGALIAWRQLQHNVKTSQEQLQATRDQVVLARHAQITDRFTRAIEQLGNNRGQVDVILGGIYALERIARDSPEDARTIAEVLTAYVRNRSPWPPCRPGQYVESAPISELPALAQRAPDIQAAVTVLVLGNVVLEEPFRLELPAVDLRYCELWGGEFGAANLARANLSKGHLRHADLRGAELSGANLSHAVLVGACLDEAKLDGACLYGADLSTASLVGATLEGASLERSFLWGANLAEAYLVRANLMKAQLGAAILRKATLSGAKLHSAWVRDVNLSDARLLSTEFNNASLVGAILRGAEADRADFRGADLSEAVLGGANLRGAVADAQTEWPSRFNPRTKGIQFLDEP